MAIFKFFQTKPDFSENNNSENNFFINIFSNRGGLWIVTFSLYMFWVFYQLFKLLWWFVSELKVWNLLFFSFSNSLNDFLTIFWISFLYFILSFLTIFLFFIIVKIFFELFFYINFFKKHFLKFKNISILFWVFVFLIFLFFWIEKNEPGFLKSFYYVIFPPFIFSFLLLCFYKKERLKIIFYIFSFLFSLFWFFMMIIWAPEYYWCLKTKNYEIEKDCIIITYKNDKYWFWKDGNIYKLDEFKSFIMIE